MCKSISYCYPIFYCFLSIFIKVQPGLFEKMVWIHQTSVNTLHTNTSRPSPQFIFPSNHLCLNYEELNTETEYNRGGADIKTLKLRKWGCSGECWRTRGSIGGLPVD